MISGNLGESARNLGMVQTYVDFMTMPEREEAAASAHAGISLSGVSFRYPQASNRAVDDVTLNIKPGETVALVGENGSGKTTLVRLITGLYAPEDGCVDSGFTFANSSAVFQNFKRYKMTLRENIGIGRTEALPEDDVPDKIDETFDNICQQAGLEGFDGYDTMLSPEFSSDINEPANANARQSPGEYTDLSGGVWQRVALARGLFRCASFDGGLIILDEPTAAIDPMEETALYNRFAAMTKGRTAIIVTHRLGSVKLAGRILVMKRGRLVEQGTHAELIEAGGEYARLYAAQQRWYREGDNLFKTH
jgi:ATP-binding cassette subfamily B protein